MEQNNVKLRDWIMIGNTDAVVCRIYSDDPNRVSIVYLDDGRKAIAEDAIFVNGKWKFEIEGPCGTYADGMSDYGEYIAILKRGYGFNYFSQTPWIFCSAFRPVFSRVIML